ncbi:MAG: CPBP family intramembrane metalloprotease [Ruminococcus sp.]|nr:CPBP family intramembrane metalloprotease [Ruminococcus sp.]
MRLKNAKSCTRTCNYQKNIFLFSDISAFCTITPCNFQTARTTKAPVAITITAVTFGIGHIVNLLAGQASLETVIQVIFAVAWGYILTFAFYKSGSLPVCIAVHSLVDAFSMFAGENITMEWVYMGATILIAVIYCLYLSRKPAALTKSYE